MNRRWSLLLPVIFISYSLSYLDRANFSFGAAAGMAKDLGIRRAELAAGVAVLPGLFPVPDSGRRLCPEIQRQAADLFRPDRLGRAGQRHRPDHQHPAALSRPLPPGRGGKRGAARHADPAGALVHRRERARANAFLVLGNPVTMLWMSLLSGYLAAGLGWRMMFIIEGLPPVIWAFVWWRLVADRPREASWFGAPTRTSWKRELAEEQRGIAPVRNYRRRLQQPARDRAVRRSISSGASASMAS